MPTKSQSVPVIPISPGIAVGRVLLIRKRSHSTLPELRFIPAENIPAEIDRFNDAIKRTKAQLIDLKKRLEEKLNTHDADIFDAHLMLVDDRSLTGEVEKRIKENLWTAEYALYDTADHFSKIFANIADEYLQERAVDIRDVAERMMANLEEMAPAEDIDDRRIVIAPTLTPSETVTLDSSKVLGFAVESGSATCHTAILARSMELPAVAGVPPEILSSLGSDDKVIIDGFSGRLIINPDARTEESYRIRAKSADELSNELRQDKELRPETTDGFEIELAINLENADQIPELAKTGAGAVGLFRTEYLFINAPQPPDEEKQFEIYKQLLLDAEDAPVTVRTMDLGGDKLEDSLYYHNEDNPFLGLRGIRFCLYGRRDLFETQLRALLRAGLYGDLRIMLPMVSSVMEVLEVKKIILTLQEQMTEQGIEHVHHPKLGVMIETPVAALMAEHLAEHVDFFSLGTNDLVQYTMAIDRGNEKVAYLYRPSHPSILQLIRMCTAAAKKHNIYVSVCGQMASDPEMIPLLAGLGVNELSTVPGALPVIRRVIRSISMHEAEMTVRAALNCATAKETLALSMKLLQKYAPEIVTPQPIIQENDAL